MSLRRSRPRRCQASCGWLRAFTDQAAEQNLRNNRLRALLGADPVESEHMLPMHLVECRGHRSASTSGDVIAQPNRQGNETAHGAEGIDRLDMREMTCFVACIMPSKVR